MAYAEKIKALLDELASVVAEMSAMEEGMTEDADMHDDEEGRLKELSERADKIKEKIEFCEKIQAKELELRSVLERSAPAAAIEKKTEEAPAVEEKRNFAVPKAVGNLKAFTGPNAEERAYRAGMHLKATLFNDSEARRWCEDHRVESRAQAGGVNSLGGVLVSDEMSSEIIRLVEEYGAFPQYARRVPMSSDTLVIARRTGGLAARAVGENTEVSTSDVTFDNVQLVAKLWGIDNRLPQSLIEDSAINLADAMSVEVAQAFAEAYDNAGFIGTGAGDPYHGTVGVATAIVDGTHSAGVVAAQGGNTTFDTLDLLDFTNVVARLPLYARRNAKWYISPAGYGSAMLRLMMAAAGNNQADVAGGANLSFLGFPVVLTHPLESNLTGTTGNVACLFGDLSQAATYATRRDIRIATDSSRFIEFDQLLTFSTARVAMVAHDLGDTTKAGPVVALQFA